MYWELIYRARHVILVFITLLLACAFAHQNELETDIQLPKLFGFTLVAWCIWMSSPEKWRSEVFLASSLVLLAVLIGEFVCLIVFSLGILLFTCIHLPVKFSLRITLTLIIGVAVSSLPLWSSNPAIATAIPVLGGLFMFRSILYLYEVQFERTLEVSWTHRLNYFFLLPNIVMPIFPIVDWRTFRSSHFKSPPPHLLERGIRWIGNGILHLVAYRAVYHYLIPTKIDMLSPGNVWLYYASNYMLIVRLAGMFHISAGILCLFGWDLPPTFNHYFFARNFNDIWQRINRYWRDFMTRVFYFPIYFKAKKRGQIQAAIIALAVVFILNWALHEWQLWWIRGIVDFSLQDVIFWGVFGLAVILNSVYALLYNPAKPGPNLEALQIAGVFWVMAILWSLWTAPSLESWKEINLSLSDNWSSALTSFSVCFGTSILIARAFLSIQARSFPGLKKISPISVIIVLASGILASKYTDCKIWSKSLNRADLEIHFEGYYDQLNPPDKQAHLNIQIERIYEDGFGPKKRLKPNLSETFKGAQFKTNSKGFIGKVPLSGSKSQEIRIALLGGSMEFGTGVEPDLKSHVIAEQLLNERLRLEAPQVSVHIANHAVPDSYLFRRLNQLSRVKALGYYDLIIWPLYNVDPAGTIKRSIKDLRRKADWQNFGDQLMPKMGFSKIINSPSPFEDSSQIQLYRAVLDRLKEETTPLLFMTAAIPSDSWQVPEELNIHDEIKKRGLPLIDGSHSYHEYPDKARLQFSETDIHLTPLAHELVANDLAEGIWNSSIFKEILDESKKGIKVAHP